MRKHLLAASAAALILGAPALADKGGGGHGNGGGQAAHADRSNGGNGGGQAMRAERGGGGNGGGHQMRQADNAGRAFRTERQPRGRPTFAAATGHDRGQGHANREVIHAERVQGRERQVALRELRGHSRAIEVRDANGIESLRVASRGFANDFGRGRGLIDGCPPGLAKKDNGCLPPGQANKLLGARLQQSFASSLLPYQYRSWYRDDPNYLYRSGDGYIYQVSRSTGIVDGLIPLFGNGDYYSVGQAWPDPYNFYNVPYQYRSYYPDTSDYAYRYGDGAIYRVNSGTGLVDSIVALLAGDLGVGSPLPVGYDVYNVPFSYRDRYYDTADNWYRYNDGYIYQVNPQTRLITAVINAIV
jgi:hypothetical protein